MNDRLTPSVRDTLIGSILALCTGLGHLKEKDRIELSGDVVPSEWVIMNAFLGPLARGFISGDSVRRLSYGLPNWFLPILRTWNSWADIEGHPLHAPPNHPVIAKLGLDSPRNLLGHALLLLDPDLDPELTVERKFCEDLIRKLSASTNRLEVREALNGMLSVAALPESFQAIIGSGGLSREHLAELLHQLIEALSTLRDTEPDTVQLYEDILHEAANRSVRTDVPIVLEDLRGGVVIGVDVVVEESHGEVSVEYVPQPELQAWSDELLDHYAVVLPRGATTEFVQGVGQGRDAAQRELQRIGYGPTKGVNLRGAVRLLGVPNTVRLAGGSAALSVAVAMSAFCAKIEVPRMTFSGGFKSGRSDPWFSAALEPMPESTIEMKLDAVRCEVLDRTLVVAARDEDRVCSEGLLVLSPSVDESTPTLKDALECVGEPWKRWSEATRHDAAQALGLGMTFEPVPPAPVDGDLDTPFVRVEQIDEIVNVLQTRGRTTQSAKAILINGPAGTGKTWIATGVARTLVDNGWRVDWADSGREGDVPSANAIGRLLDLHEIHAAHNPRLLIVDGLHWENEQEASSSLQELASEIVERRHLNLLCMTRLGEDTNWETDAWDSKVAIVGEDRISSFLDSLLDSYYPEVSHQSGVRNAILARSRNDLPTIVELAKKAQAGESLLAGHNPESVMPGYRSLSVETRRRLAALSSLRVPTPVNWFDPRETALLQSCNWANMKRLGGLQGWLIPIEAKCLIALDSEDPPITTISIARESCLIEAVEFLFRDRRVPIATAVRIISSRDEKIFEHVLHRTSDAGGMTPNSSSGVLFARLNDPATELPEVLALIQAIAPSVDFERLEQPAERVSSLIVSRASVGDLTPRELALSLRLVWEHATTEVQDQLAERLTKERIAADVLSQFGWAQEKVNLLRVLTRWIEYEDLRAIIQSCFDSLILETEPDPTAKKFRLLLVLSRYVEPKDLMKSTAVMGLVNTQFHELASSADVAAAFAVHYHLTDTDFTEFRDELVALLHHHMGNDSLDVVREALTTLREARLPTASIVVSIDRIGANQALGRGAIAEIIRRRLLDSTPASFSMFLSTLYGIHPPAAFHVLYPSGDAPDKELIQRLASRLRETNDAKGTGFVLGQTAKIDQTYFYRDGGFSQGLAEAIGEDTLRLLVWGEPRHSVLYYLADALASSGVQLPAGFRESILKHLPDSIVTARRRGWACNLALRLAQPDSLGEEFLEELSSSLPFETMIRLMCEVRDTDAVRYVHELAMALHPDSAGAFADVWRSNADLRKRFLRRLSHRTQAVDSARIIETIMSTLKTADESNSVAAVGEEFGEEWWFRQIIRERRPANVMTTFIILDRIDQQLARKVFELVFPPSQEGRDRIDSLVRNAIVTYNHQVLTDFVVRMEKVAPGRISSVLKSYWSTHGSNASLWHRFMRDIPFITNPREQGAVISNLSRMGFVPGDRFRRDLLFRWVGLDRRAAQVPMSMMKSPAAVRSLLQGFATWRDGSVFSALSVANGNGIANRIREGAEGDVNDGIRLLGMLSALRNRITVTTSRGRATADADTLRSLSDQARTIMAALDDLSRGWRALSVAANWNKWISRVDAAAWVDALREWERAPGSSVLSNLARHPDLLLVGKRSEPYSRTLLKFGWLARATNHAGMSLAAGAPPELWSDRVSDSVRLWVLTWLRHTDWRDVEFQRASEALMRSTVVLSSPRDLAIVMRAALEEPRLIGRVESLGEELLSLLKSMDPQWLEVAIEAAERSEVLAGLVSQHTEELIRHVDDAFLFPNLSASRCHILLERWPTSNQRPVSPLVVAAAR